MMDSPNEQGSVDISVADPDPFLPDPVLKNRIRKLLKNAFWILSKQHFYNIFLPDLNLLWQI